MEGILETAGVNTQGLISGFNSGVGVFMWFMLFATIIIVFLYLVYFTGFKINFRVKELIAGRKKILIKKARIFKNKDGVVILQIRNANPFAKKIELPAPPEEATEIGAGGTIFIDAYRTSTGEYIYLKDTANIPQIPQEILKIENSLERYTKISEWKKANQIVNPYLPITTNHRIFFTGQIRKAHEKKQRTIMDLIRDLAPLMAIVIMFVMFLLFFGKAVQPFQEMADKAIQLQKENVAYVEQIKEMKNDIQVIKNEVLTKNEEQPTTPPN